MFGIEIFTTDSETTGDIISDAGMKSSYPVPGRVIFGVDRSGMYIIPVHGGGFTIHFGGYNNIFTNKVLSGV